MSTAAGAGTVLTVRGDVRAVRARLGEFFAAHGWEVHEGGHGRVEIERGSRRRTVLLGAFAGRGFHLHAAVELCEAGGAVGERVTEIHYLWGADAGRALGGTAGRACAARVHSDTAVALEQELEADGRLLRARRL